MNDNNGAVYFVDNPGIAETLDMRDEVKLSNSSQRKQEFTLGYACPVEKGRYISLVSGTT